MMNHKVVTKKSQRITISHKEIIQISESRQIKIGNLKGQLKIQKNKLKKKDDQINELQKKIDSLTEINSCYQNDLSNCKKDNNTLKKINNMLIKDDVATKEFKKENDDLKEDMEKCKTQLGTCEKLIVKEKWRTSYLAKLCSLLALGQSSDNIEEVLQGQTARKRWIISREGMSSREKISRHETQNMGCVIYRGHRLYKEEIEEMIKFLKVNKYWVDNIPQGFHDLDQADDWATLFGNVRSLN